MRNVRKIRARALCEALERRVLLSGQPVSAAQAIDFVQGTWNLTSLSTTAITNTLNTDYSGIPYSDWIGFFINASKIEDQLANANYQGAASTAYNYGLAIAGDAALGAIGLSGVGAVVELATWPISARLNNFLQIANAGAFKDQAALYFQARQEGNSAQVIVNPSQSGPDTPLPEGGDIYIGANGWLFGQLQSTGTEITDAPIGVITSANFYGYEENQYLAAQAQSQLSLTSNEVKNEFYAAATPGAPVITTQPQSQTIDSGKTATFSVQATGSGTLDYQWLDNGSGISGATSSTYTTGSAGRTAFR